MGDLLMRNISDAMKQELASRAERSGNSLSDEIKLLLRFAIAADAGTKTREVSAWESLRAVLAPKTEAEADEAEAFVRIMEDIEAERKADFGRPLEDLE
jgi:plasmid stability protein